MTTKTTRLRKVKKNVRRRTLHKLGGDIIILNLSNDKRVEYNVDDCLGKGAYAVVYKGFLYENEEKTQVAIKELEYDQEDDVSGQTKTKADKELEILTKCEEYPHPNIVKYYGHFKDDEKKNIILLLNYVTKRYTNIYTNRKKKLVISIKLAVYYRLHVG